MARPKKGFRRNIGIIAHIDAGKTTVTERILFFSGKKHKVGEVHDGAATMDYMEEERKRGITITAAATTVDWRDHEISIIDTPGHVDFTVEVERSMRVLDGAVGVFCAVGGVQPQSETVWRQANRYHVPRIAYINKMDRIGADFKKAGTEIRDKLGGRPIAIQIPIGEGGSYEGIIDLVKQVAYYFDTEGKVTEKPIPKHELERTHEWRIKLLEKLANCDDELMEAYFENECADVPVEKLKQVLRKATLDRVMTPVLCGSALKNNGVQTLIDAVVDYLPSPWDIPEVKGINPDNGEPISRSATPDQPASALAFKTIAEMAGDLTFIRVYTGRIKTGDQLLVPRTGKTQRIGRLVRMHAATREPVEEAVAGDIVACVSLKDIQTGDTLCDENHAVTLESLNIPDAVISMAIQPESRQDQDKLAKALGRYAREDPTFRRFTDQETGETVISGMGELHLEVIINRIRDESKVTVITGAPRVAYRQTIAKAIEIEARHKKQSGGSGQFAVAKVQFEPVLGTEQERDENYDGILEFVDATKGGVIPREYIPAIEKGIRNYLVAGGALKFPIVGIKATVVDGAFHEVDSSDMAFQVAGRMAIQQAMEGAGTKILEPMFDFEIVTPDEYQGAVNGDLQSRRGEIEEFQGEGNIATIRGRIPVAETFQYTTALRGMTQGRGTALMLPSGYQILPEQFAQKLRAERLKSKETVGAGA